MTALLGIAALGLGLACWAALDLSIRIGLGGGAGRRVDGWISAASLLAAALVLSGLVASLAAA